MSLLSFITAAGSAGAGGAGLDVDEVFSTYLYKGTGTGSNLTVTNNIDLSTEGGLVWVKNRDSSAAHALFDTVRGQNIIESQSTGGQDAFSAYGGSASASYNTNGFGINGTGASNLNSSGVDYASWTFRKAPKFFDVVTYTGNGNASQTISHSLGTTVGMLIIKRTSGSGAWNVYHRGTGNNKSLELNTSNAAYNNVPWGSVTSSSFEARSDILGNVNGATYVAYLFAHNDGDGEFGPDADQDVIKCGSFSTPSSGSVTVDLGFEPQWLLVKSTNQAYSWEIYDVMRGLTVNGHKILTAQTSNAEGSNTTAGDTQPTSTGFSASTNYWGANVDLIYMAIRRGPLAEPESATDVFAINTTGTNDSPNNNFTVGFDPDLSLNTQTNGNQRYLVSRLLGNGTLKANDETVVNNISDASFFGNPSGTIDLNTNFWGTASNLISWSWKRAPGYFDVIAYSGTGSARTITHNLGVVPEMMWVKARNATQKWAVYHSGMGNTKYMRLNDTSQQITSSTRWNDTTPTASVFTVGTDSQVNNSSYNYIAYLFATVSGVSKVGSFSHTSGQTQNIDCGFSSGARFVLVKQYGSTGAWFLYDTTRGIVAGNDPRIKLDDTSAQNTSNDDIDPLSSGFTLTTNFSGGDYIFYAIA